MKKQLHLIAGALLVAATANAQITLNSSSYPTIHFGTDSLKSSAYVTTYPSFAAGTGGTFDLTGITDTSYTQLAYKVAAATPGTFAFADSNEYAFGSYVYQGNVQSAITSSGIIESGINIADAAFYLGTLGDTVFVPAQNAIYTVPQSTTAASRTLLQFPATNGTTWTSTYESNFDFQLSYLLTAPFPSYNHAPGQIRSFFTENNTVIGYGKMKVTNMSGTASGLMDVLQVKTTTTRVDTFYLNGGPSDPGLPTLLSLLNFTQGQSTTTYSQSFYRAGETTPLATALFTDNSDATPTSVTTHENRLASATGVATIANGAGVKVYPNPVTGRILSVDVPAVTGVWSYELVNVTGKTVAAEVLSVNGTHGQIQLGDAVVAGIYYVRLANNGNQFSVNAVEVK